MIGPEPRHAAKRGFQTAGPIDSSRIRVLGLPVPPLAQCLVGKAAITREPVGFSQSDQVLMAVQFPCDLAVANFREVQISNFVKCLPRSPLSVDCIQMPIDRLAVVKVFIAEK